MTALEQLHFEWRWHFQGHRNILKDKEQVRKFRAEQFQLKYRLRNKISFLHLETFKPNLEEGKCNHKH